MWQKIVLAWKQRKPQPEMEQVILLKCLGDAMRALEPTRVRLSTKGFRK